MKQGQNMVTAGEKEAPMCTDKEDPRVLTKLAKAGTWGAQPSQPRGVKPPRYLPSLSH